MRNYLSYFKKNRLCGICAFLCVLLFSINANAQQAGTISSPIKVSKPDIPVGPPERIDPPAPNPVTGTTEYKQPKSAEINISKKKKAPVPNKIKGEKKVLNKTPIDLTPPVAAPPIASKPNSYSEEKSKTK